jgi:serine/threonine protein kinase
VYLASRNGRRFALKKLEKARITKYDKVQAVFRERDISSELSEHTNVVKFHGSFQDEECLYFLLEYCPFGSL